MGLYYVDSSTLVKLYISEPGDQVLLALAPRSLGHRLAVLAIASVELRSTFRRLQRQGDLLQDDVVLLVERLTADLRTRFLTQPVTDRVFDTACDLIDRHTLRAYDAV